MAHGTHQNQYTKRRALLHCASNHTSSNNDSDDNVASSQDGGARQDEQHGHFAETGFAAQNSARVDVKSTEEAGRNAAQDADSDKAEVTLPVGESGVLSRQQGAESSGRHKGGTHGSSDESKKGRRRKQNSRDADASSGDNATPMGGEAEEGAVQLLRHKDSSAHTQKQASKAVAATATPVAAQVVSDGLPSRQSGLDRDQPTSGTDASAQIRGTALDAATDQSAKVTNGVDKGPQADPPSAEVTANASLPAVARCAEAATSSGDPTPPLPQTAESFVHFCLSPVCHKLQRSLLHRFALCLYSYLPGRSCVDHLCKVSVTLNISVGVAPTGYRACTVSCLNHAHKPGRETMLAGSCKKSHLHSR